MKIFTRLDLFVAFLGAITGCVITLCAGLFIGIFGPNTLEPQQIIMAQKCIEMKGKVQVHSDFVVCKGVVE